MVNNKQNGRKKGLSIDEKIQILVNHGDISSIKNRKKATDEEKFLASIKHSLKVAYKEGKLTARQIELLEEHGMTWKERVRGKKSLQILIEANVDIGEVGQAEENLTGEKGKLGRAKHYLRVLYNRGELSEDIIREAKEHGMVWDRVTRGEKALKYLIDSGKNIADIQIRGENLTEEERKLGEIKHYLKRLYREGKLSEDIVRQAEEHGMIWNERDKKGKRKNKSTLEELKREKEELEDKEERAKILLGEVERQAREEGASQDKDMLDGEER